MDRKMDLLGTRMQSTDNHVELLGKRLQAMETDIRGLNFRTRQAANDALNDAYSANEAKRKAAEATLLAAEAAAAPVAARAAELARTAPMAAVPAGNGSKRLTFPDEGYKTPLPDDESGRASTARKGKEGRNAGTELPTQVQHDHHGYQEPGELTQRKWRGAHHEGAATAAASCGAKDLPGLDLPPFPRQRDLPGLSISPRQRDLPSLPEDGPAAAEHVVVDDANDIAGGGASAHGPGARAPRTGNGGGGAGHTSTDSHSSQGTDEGEALGDVDGNTFNASITTTLALAGISRADPQFVNRTKERTVTVPPQGTSLKVYPMHPTLLDVETGASELHGLPYEVATRNSASPHLAKVFTHHKPLYTIPAGHPKDNWYDEAVAALAARTSQPGKPHAELTYYLGPYSFPEIWVDVVHDGADKPTIVLFYVKIGYDADQLVRNRPPGVPARVFTDQYQADIKTWLNSVDNMSATGITHDQPTYVLDVLYGMQGYRAATSELAIWRDFLTMLITAPPWARPPRIVRSVSRGSSHTDEHTDSYGDTRRFRLQDLPVAQLQKYDALLSALPPGASYPMWDLVTILSFQTGRLHNIIEPMVRTGAYSCLMAIATLRKEGYLRLLPTANHSIRTAEERLTQVVTRLAQNVQTAQYNQEHVTSLYDVFLDAIRELYATLRGVPDNMAPANVVESEVRRLSRQRRPKGQSISDWMTESMYRLRGLFDLLGVLIAPFKSHLDNHLTNVVEQCQGDDTHTSTEFQVVIRVANDFLDDLCSIYFHDPRNTAHGGSRGQGVLALPGAENWSHLATGSLLTHNTSLPTALHNATHMRNVVSRASDLGIINAIGQGWGDRAESLELTDATPFAPSLHATYGKQRGLGGCRFQLVALERIAAKLKPGRASRALEDATRGVTAGGNLFAIQDSDLDGINSAATTAGSPAAIAARTGMTEYLHDDLFLLPDHGKPAPPPQAAQAPSIDPAVQSAVEHATHTAMTTAMRAFMDSQRQENAHGLEMQRRQILNSASADRQHAVPLPDRHVLFADATRTERAPTPPAPRFGGQRLNAEHLRRKNLGGMAMRASRDAGPPHMRKPGERRMRYQGKPLTDWTEILPEARQALNAKNITESNWPALMKEMCTLCAESDHLLGHCLKVFAATTRGQDYFGQEKATQRVQQLVKSQGQMALAEALDCLLADDQDEYCLACDAHDDVDAMSRVLFYADARSMDDDPYDVVYCLQLCTQIAAAPGSIA